MTTNENTEIRRLFERVQVDLANFREGLDVRFAKLEAQLAGMERRLYQLEASIDALPRVLAEMIEGKAKGIGNAG